MPSLDPRVTAYIAQAPEFAQPILQQIRDVVHAACPEVVETLKWSRPHFDYKGMMCGMSYFKAHCALGFWKGELVVPGADDKNDEGMGQFGRLTTVKDLPAKKVLMGYVKKAMALNDDGVQAPSRAKPKTAPRPVVVPDYFAKALRAQPAAAKHFEAFSPSAKREYTDWLEEAKAEATRERRMLQALEWIAEGKQRNWKYQNC